MTGRTHVDDSKGWRSAWQLFRTLTGLLRTVWLMLGGCVLVLVTLELLMTAFRKTQASAGDGRAYADGYHGAPWVKEYFRELARSDTYRWEPYVYWRHTPLHGAYIHVNERGLRETTCGELDRHARAPEERLTIWVFGGSAIWGFGARDEHTIPSELCRSVAQAMNRRVEVVNFGETGYISTQEVIALLRELQRGQRPDLVVFCDGTNDTFAAFRNKTAGIPYGESNRTDAFKILNAAWNADIRTVLSLFLSRSEIRRFVPRLARSPYESMEAIDQERELPTDVSQRLATAVMQVYAANVRFVETLSRQSGFVALFYWQPVIFTKRHLTAYEQQRAEEHRARRAFFLQVHEQMKRHPDLAPNERFYDLTPLFAETKEPYFIDSLHVTETGNALVAKQMAADISRVFHAPERSRLP